jgi:4a-hydroxytetrahydrobiopterin dehydratase
MEKLSNQKCVACQGGIPPMNEAEIARYMKQLEEEASDWEVLQNRYLKKTWKFEDFKTALEFVNKIGALAEEQGHHPNINFGWGFVEITLWTHKINGLHESDFVLAAKIERVKI